MKRVKSLFICRFAIHNNAIESSLLFLHNLLASYPYMENEGFGFRNIVSSDVGLSASYIKRTPSYIQEYDENSAGLVQKNVYLFSSIEFSVDLSTELILVEGGASQMNSLRSALRNIFSVAYSIEPVDISPLSIYEKLRSKSIHFDIKHLTISSFRYHDGVIGRFSGEIIQQKIVKELLKEYSGEIAKMTFLIDINERDPLTLQVFPNGSLKYLASEDDLVYLISYIKKILL